MIRTLSLLPWLLTLTVGCTGKEEDTGDTGDTADTDTGDTDTGDTDTGDTDTDTDTGEQVDEYAALVTYMGANGLDLPTLYTSWVKSAQEVFDAGLENYFIVDLRTSDVDANGVVDFQDGHVPGAHSVAMADVITYVRENNTEDLPVLVYCYTGTTSAQATMALRLVGIDAVSLKWGMSGWHTDFDRWSANLGDAALDYPDAWSTDASPAVGAFEAPVIATGETDGAAILEAQLNARVLTGTKKQAIADVLSAPENYQIFNYWAATDWDALGHIDGATQITPGEIGLDDLAIFDRDATIVIYCWTGQTGAMFAGWLQALGYDAHTLLYSANGMIYSSLTANKFSAGSVPNLAYETGE